MRGRVLVVDDEPLIAKAVRRILGTQHDVEVSSSGAEALARIARGERFDVILSDVMMPEMDGLQLCKEIAQQDPAQAERMIFLTGSHPQALPGEVEARYLSKPFNMEELRGAVARLVG